MKFRDYIRRAYLNSSPGPDNLVENRQTYKQMMQGIIQAWSKLDSDIARGISEDADMYRKLYRRKDRIVWALRWLRLEWLINLRDQLSQSNPDEDGSVDQLKKWSERAMNKFISELSTGGEDQGYILEELRYFSSSRFANKISHFMSYVDENSDNYIEKMDKYVFDRQVPRKIMFDLSRIEDEWKENREREIPHADDEHGEDATKLIDFGDGFAWWNLNKDYCNTEGQAMGHCGNNSHMRKPGDQVLSLRQEITRGGERYHIPYLTFILDDDGQLGEMKGRGNDKPQKRYHPYIVELLKSRYVDGIKGGGYLPENNFSINDLDDETRDKLIKQNPSLEPLSEKYRRLGPVPEVMNRLMDEIRKVGLPEVYGWDDDNPKTVILHQWDDLEDFSRFINFGPLEEALSYDADDAKMDEDDLYKMVQELKLDDRWIEEFLDTLDYPYIEKIASDLDIEGDVRERRVQRAVALYADRSRYRDAIARSLILSAGDTNKDLTTDPEWKEYLALLLSTAASGFSNSYAEVDYDQSTLPDGEIRFVDEMDNLFDYVEAASMGDDMDGDEGWYVATNAKDEGDWVHHDSYDAEEYWDEIERGNGSDEDQKLIKKFYKKIKNSTGGGDLDEIIKGFDFVEASDLFRRYIDWYEEEQFDDTDLLIMEMKKRAGI